MATLQINKYKFLIIILIKIIFNLNFYKLFLFNSNFESH